MYCKECDPLVLNCVIARNVASADQGGGVYGPAIVIGSTIVQNTASPDGGGGLAGGYWSAHMHNCIVWGNQPNQVAYAIVDFSDVEGGYAGTGNINADPLFVDFDGGDYHVQPGSPCIDHGSPTYQPAPFEVDCDGQRRIWDGDDNGPAVIDMGVDEYGSFRWGDLNCDGVRDFGDIHPLLLALADPAAYAAAYPDCDVLNADCNCDGAVDFDDINPFIDFLGANVSL